MSKRKTIKITEENADALKEIARRLFGVPITSYNMALSVVLAHLQTPQKKARVTRGNTETFG